MGEAAAVLNDDLHNNNTYGNGFSLVCTGKETTLRLANTEYLIGGYDDESSIQVQLFHQSLNKWIKPTVLGTKPGVGSDHWAVPIDNNRVLVIKNGSMPDDDDTLWFLEVDTPFVRHHKKKLLGTADDDQEVVAWSKGVLGYPGKPIVISGPSGVGKGTLISMLMNDFPSMFGFSVSHTTRSPREMERHGVHYHFTQRSLMESDIKHGKFLEFASVHGNLYGTSIEAVELVADVGKRCILDIDVQGARSVRASSLDAIFIFVSPPSYEDLEKRLRSRGTETEEQIQKRLRNAKGELDQANSPGLFDHVLVNDDLEACYNTLKNLLGLHGSAENPKRSDLEKVVFPPVHSVTKVGSKIYLNTSHVDASKAAQNSFVLDVSSLVGGAPGRTRGLDLFPVQQELGVTGGLS